jgi:hypothetical protein
MTFDEIQDVLSKLGLRYRRQADGLWLGFHLPDGRHQDILITPFVSAGDAFVNFASRVADVDQVDPLDLLERNFSLALGHFCVHENQVWLVHTALLATLDIDEVREPIERLVVLADSFQEEFTEADDN